MCGTGTTRSRMTGTSAKTKFNTSFNFVHRGAANNRLPL